MPTLYQNELFACALQATATTGKACAGDVARQFSPAPKTTCFSSSYQIRLGELARRCVIPA